MTLRLLSIIIMVIVCSPAAAWAQRAEIVPPSDTVRVGRPVEIGVVVEYPAEYDLDLPRPLGDEPAMLGDFELSHLVDRTVDLVDHQLIRDSLVFEAMTFVLDTASIGGERLRLIGARDTTSIAPAVVQVPVASTWQEGDPPRDLAPIVDVPDRRWIWGIVALAILAAGIAFWIRRRSRRRGGESVDDEPRPEPIEEARLRLKQLGAEIPEGPELQHGFAIELTDIIRTYLARRFEIPALEMTSREILHHPSISLMLETSTVDASSLLDLADRIKFARAEATGPMLRTSIDEALTWLSDMERRAARQDHAGSEVPA